MSVLVRSAASGDLQRLLEIVHETPSAAQWPEREYRKLFAPEGGQNRKVLVISCDEQVQGFIVGRPAGDQWEVENIAVALRARRQGLGSHLIREFLDRVRRSGTAVYLEVRESNVAARNLYKKLGFNEAGRRKSYYREPQEDAIILRFSF